MLRTLLRRGLPALGAAMAMVLTLGLTPGTAAASHGRSGGGTRLYTPPPNPGALKQISGLLRKGKIRDAALLTKMISTPQAVWFTGGTPAEVRASVRETVTRAALLKTVPILVAYNIPYRDCSLYSAGGALDRAAYQAWIDGFAAGLGKHRAIVLLEPDGLGIIPFHTDLNGNLEWCQPRDADGNPQPGASPEERFAALNYAVDRLTRQPGAQVYLDGTHSGWLSVGDAANRLVRAGVQRAAGFFLNVSNYQLTPQSQKYGTWISQCIAFANNPEDGGWRLGHYDYCASQYYPANPDDFSTWPLTDQWYADNLGTAKPTTHFVVDTSRNGTGPNDMTRYAEAPYNQPADVVAALRAGNWCNPPGAGVGLRPTTRTGVPLLDAYLWVKIPGESDGTCDIAGGARAWDYTVYNPWNVTGDAQRTFDPLWGRVDPRAGEWFDEQALELARKANPPLL